MKKKEKGETVLCIVNELNGEGNRESRDHQTSATEGASHARETVTADNPMCHPPLFVFYSPASSSWQPVMFPLLLTILLLPGLLSLQFVTSFSLCKVILQVKVGHS